MNDRHNLIDTIRAGLVPVHWDGHKFVGAGIVITILMFLLWAPLGWLALLLTGYVAYFFRDPPRVTPVREGLIIAPADGKITSVALDTPRSELGLADRPYTCISIFLSVFDVHINRAPVDGQVVRRIYIPGLYLNAALDKASEDNEREAMVFRSASGTEIGVVRIAGLIARRIVTFVRDGQPVEAGARIGLIRFGSRVDIYIPSASGILVCEGQRVVGGETVLADLRSDEPSRSGRVS
ncbi:MULTISPECIES: phosphatidylserine decarboxylase [Rhodomicrobium]|uniref:phosphatidylserine decarboxylase n=1 Tax=Rhodomicrobium TaxID=1068 RepID=UPI000B4A9C57|nr:MULTISPECIES: phosphatidylserine decarboxylase [Rhodomicrobium]